MNFASSDIRNEARPSSKLRFAARVREVGACLYAFCTRGEGARRHRFLPEWDVESVCPYVESVRALLIVELAC
jgi:hypothetical protein